MGLPTAAFVHLGNLATHAARGAPMAEGQPTRFPVLLFSHGRCGFRQHNTVLAEELVSHGFIVVAIDHPHAASGVEFPDGRIAWFEPRLLPPWPREVSPGSELALEHVLPYLARDCLFALEQVHELDRGDPNGILTGRLDLGRTGIYGVSLGGMVAAEALQLEPRFGPCLIMDTYLPPSTVARGMRRPVMWISRDAATMRREGWSEADVTDTQSSMHTGFERLGGDGYLVLVPGMYHIDFSDGRLLSPLIEERGIAGSIEGGRTRQIVNTWSRAFFDRHLRDMPVPLLDGRTEAFPEVRFSSRRATRSADEESRVQPGYLTASGGRSM
jgi:hypothetical protein